MDSRQFREAIAHPATATALVAAGGILALAGYAASQPDPHSPERIAELATLPVIDPSPDGMGRKPDQLAYSENASHRQDERIFWTAAVAAEAVGVTGLTMYAWQRRKQNIEAKVQQGAPISTQNTQSVL